MKLLQDLEPTVVILMGEYGIELIRYLWKDEGLSFDDWVGWKIPAQKINAWVCPTYHPSMVLEQGKGPKGGLIEMAIGKHLKEAVKACDAKPYVKVPNYEKRVKIAPDWTSLLKFSTRAAKEHLPFAFDYETTMLKPDHPKAEIVCVSVSDGEETLAINWNKNVAITMKGLLIGATTKKIASNCFSGETKFLTKEFGTVSLKKMKGKTVTVLNHEGRWVPAKIKCFGKQEVIPVTFSRRNFLKTVWCTLDHRWIKEDGSVIKTSELQKTRVINWVKTGNRDQVPYQTAPRKITNQKDYLEGVKHGIVYGDGSKMGRRKNSFSVRLCGHKNELGPIYFKEHNFSSPPSYNGDQQIYLTQQKENLKEIPKNKSDSYLIGFVRGLMATDGCVAQNGQMSISGPIELAQWCQKKLGKLGYLFQCSMHLYKYGKSGYGGNKKIVQIYLSRESIKEEDLLTTKHKRNFKPVSLGPYKYNKRGKESKFVKVYCAVVPDGKSFTLADGLVTGNCKFEDRWSKRILGVDVKGWWHDTMLAAHVLDNRGGISSIKFQAFVLLGQPDYDSSIKEYLKSRDPGGYGLNRVKQAPIKPLLQYCGMDSLLEYLVAKKQKKLLKKEEG
jgi:hypothetical protein